MNKEQYRQGDVLVERVESDSVPTSAKPVARDGGRVILAHGEVTGHAHAIADPKVKLHQDPANQATYLEVKEAIAMLTHDEHATIPLARGNYTVERQREYTPAAIRDVKD